MAEVGTVRPVVLDDRTCAALLPERSPRGHKGSHGTLLVLAGSLDYAGAALLVARAAGRAGVGLVRLAVPESLQAVFAGRVLEATTLGLPETDLEGEVDPDEALERILDVDHHALVLGPGLRPGLATVELIEALLGVAEEAGTPPAVIDAEALNSLASRPGWWERVGRRCVLTPHPGEFRRLLSAGPEELGDPDQPLESDDERAELSRRAAQAWGQMLVLKGAGTVIAAGDGQIARAPFENPALASAGTGDVLSGTIGALLAQRLGAWDAARLGVYLHGLAGEQVRARIGDSGLLASDLPDEIAHARRKLAALRDDDRHPFASAPGERS
ncbi:MAG TPA: NAD(P)H-hydrate dehydratase [Candidatus Limnocylindrales bacterium]|jgi:NAD(P)H-hydrate epimerase|nr:NAD(P)H-hydrate dehydratase [Candidatus Limnocylindrales bacterium]